MTPVEVRGGPIRRAPFWKRGMTTISFELDTQLASLDVLCEQLEHFCAEAGISKKQKFEINLALDELFTNILSHGFRDDRTHRIRISVSHTAQVVTIVIQDDGIPFNPLHAAAPELKCPFDDRKVGGLGIHLIRAYIDEMAYERRGNQNVLTLRKFLKN